MFEHYYKESSIEYRCSRCDRLTKCTRKMGIWQLPPVLIVHLNRWGTELLVVNLSRWATGLLVVHLSRRVTEVLGVHLSRWATEVLVVHLSRRASELYCLNVY